MTIAINYNELCTLIYIEYIKYLERQHRDFDRTTIEYNEILESKIKIIFDNFIDDTTRSILIYKFIYGYTYSAISDQINLSAVYISDKYRNFMHKLDSYIRGRYKDKLNDRINNYEDARYLKLNDFKFKATYNCLTKNGYQTDADLNGIKYTDFIKIHGAGKRYWEDCKQYMDKHQLYYDDYKYDEKEVKERFMKIVGDINKKYKLDMDKSDIENIATKVDGINSYMKYLYEVNKALK